jgi:hypothetical protein
MGSQTVSKSQGPGLCLPACPRGTPPLRPALASCVRLPASVLHAPRFLSRMPFYRGPGLCQRLNPPAPRPILPVWGRSPNRRSPSCGPSTNSPRKPSGLARLSAGLSHRYGEGRRGIQGAGHDAVGPSRGRNTPTVDGAKIPEWLKGMDGKPRADLAVSQSLG